MAPCVDLFPGIPLNSFWVLKAISFADFLVKDIIFIRSGEIPLVISHAALATMV